MYVPRGGLVPSILTKRLLLLLIVMFVINIGPAVYIFGVQKIGKIALILGIVQFLDRSGHLLLLRHHAARRPLRQLPERQEGASMLPARRSRPAIRA